MYIPKALEKYKHFKGNCYQIICVAENSEDGQKEVVYQALYAPFKIYTRPLEMFISKVDKEKYPDASQEYRFELLDEEGFIVNREDVCCDNTKECCNENISGGAETVENEAKEISQEESDVVGATEISKDEPVRGQINPILEKFLDASTSESKIEILNEEKDNLTPEILTPMELSIGMEPSDDEPLARYRDIKNFLLLKQKYERNHR